jgi:glycosyltransferase involved in cell wall biosynthesis
MQINPLDTVTPVIITLNEQANIKRTLDQLTWAREIVVIDSGSDDETLTILKAFPNIRVIYRKFDSMAKQWNFGLEQVSSEWVLSLDADYFVTAELRSEIQTTLVTPDADGYMIPFRYCVSGKPLRASLLPPRCALFRKSSSSYFDDGHTQRLLVNGKVSDLLCPILHDDRKPFPRWFKNQHHYVKLEAEKLCSLSFRQLSMSDRVRALIVPAPFLVFFLCLIGKGCLLDGWQGLYYTLQRTLAEILLSLQIVKHRISCLLSS